MKFAWGKKEGCYSPDVQGMVGFSEKKEVIDISAGIKFNKIAHFKKCAQTNNIKNLPEFFKSRSFWTGS